MTHRDCRAVINIAGTQHHCELAAPHPALAHANTEAHAVWCSDGEAIRYAPKRITA